jgi:4-amino-4-deoxy-L-arabinose transferase-like glycosyltransferase
MVASESPPVALSSELASTPTFGSGKVLLALAIVAIAVRVAWWLLMVNAIENEGAEYARAAENLFTRGNYHGLLGTTNLALPPLYPVLIGLVGSPIGDLELAGRLISLASGVGLVVLLYLVTYRLFGPRAAFFSGLLVAIQPALVALSVAVLTESLYMFLVWLGLFLAFESMRTRNSWYGVSCGVVLGLGYMVRPESLAFSAVVSAVLGLWLLVHDRRWVSALREASLPFVSAVIVAAPYVAYLSWESGRFCWEGKSGVNELTNVRMRSGMGFMEASHGLGTSPQLDPPYRDGPNLTADHRSFLRSAHARMGDSLSRTLRAAPWRGRDAIRSLQECRFLSAPAVPYLALVGVVISGWWRNRRGEAVLLGCFGVLQGLTLLAVEHHFVRYFVPLLPMMIPWAAATIDRLCDWAGRLLPNGLVHQRLAALTTVVGAIAIVAMGAWAYPVARQDGIVQESADDSVKLAGLWIRQQTQRDGVERSRPFLMGYSNAASYYADAAYYNLLPYSESARALEYVRQKNPDYIVLRSWERVWAPYVQQWLDDGIPDERAKPVFEALSASGVFVRVWKWTIPPEQPTGNLLN